MKRIGNIYSEIVSIDNCKAAIRNASENKRRRRSVQKILDNSDYYAHELSERLQQLSFCTEYTYKKIVDKPSGKERDLYIPAFFPDQCAHHAIMQVLKPYIIKSSYEWSCSCIHGRGINGDIGIAGLGIDRITGIVHSGKFNHKVPTSSFWQVSNLYHSSSSCTHSRVNFGKFLRQKSRSFSLLFMIQYLTGLAVCDLVRLIVIAAKDITIGVIHRTQIP